jgi:hypothetical protein
VLFAKFGGASTCAVQTTILSTSMASAVIYAEFGGAGCTVRTSILNTSMASTVLYTEAAKARTCLAA